MRPRRVAKQHGVTRVDCSNDCVRQAGGLDIKAVMAAPRQRAARRQLLNVRRTPFASAGPFRHPLRWNLRRRGMSSEESPAPPEYPVNTDTPNGLRFAALYSDLRQLAERQLRRSAGASDQPDHLASRSLPRHVREKMRYFPIASDSSAMRPGSCAA